MTLHPAKALALAVAVLGNGLGAASFLWWGLHPYHLFFAAMFGWSARWALDELTTEPGGRTTDPHN